MRFTVSSAELKEQLLIINGAINSNPVLPILEDFLFKIENNVLTIAGTDLETFVIAELQVQSDQDGSIAIPAKILVDTLKQLPPQPITFDIDLETFSTTIQSSYGRYELAGEDGDEYPKIPVPDDANEVEIPAALLLEGINRTIFATSSDELRPAMTGVYIKIENNSITFVATDAHKLVKYQFNDIQATISAAFIVPKKALSLLTKALANASLQVQISYSKSNAFFYFGNHRLSCRLIDAKYPDYDMVIPKKNTNVMLIQRGDFLSSLKRISNFANQTTHQVKLHLADSSLTIEAEDVDYSNKATEQLPCNYTGNNMTIGFNAKFLVDMLNTIGSDTIKFEFSTPSSAGILRPEEDDINQELLMLAMPMMLHA
jgi:DNA polymerase-3 subunit beta